MKPTLPEPYTARPATIDDAAAVTELMNLVAMDVLGHPTTDVSEALTDWSSPSCNPTTNTRLVFAGPRLIGYAGLWIEPPYTVINGWARVHPEHKNWRARHGSSMVWHRVRHRPGDRLCGR